MYYVYVIQSKKDKQFYTGFTRDLQNRIQEHNTGRVPSTKERGPFELIYYEASPNEQDAIAREKYLKSGMGKRYLRNRLKRFLSLTGRWKNRICPTKPQKALKSRKGNELFSGTASGIDVVKCIK
jgi:putative endonuclease